VAASLAVVPMVKRPRCSDQRRFHRAGGPDHDRERVAARVVDDRAPLPVVDEPHVARRVDCDRRVSNQGVARVARVRRNRLADPALGGGAFGRVDAAEVADPVRRRPREVEIGRGERKAEIQNS